MRISQVDLLFKEDLWRVPAAQHQGYIDRMFLDDADEVDALPSPTSMPLFDAAFEKIQYASVVLDGSDEPLHPYVEDDDADQWAFASQRVERLLERQNPIDDWVPTVVATDGGRASWPRRGWSSAQRWRMSLVGPATRAGIYMAILALGCVLAALNPSLAAAKGGHGIALLHAVATSLFALTLLLDPWRIRPWTLGVLAVLLGTSVTLEAMLARYPWPSVQLTVRLGCGIVALSMASLLVFSLRPTKSMRAFFFTALVVGAIGSLMISLGTLLATGASYPTDHSAALANLVLAIGAWGLGRKCLGLRVVPVISFSARALRRFLEQSETPSPREPHSRDVPLASRNAIAIELKRHFKKAGALVGV